MKDTAISELVEDEKQKLLYVFDYITERCFFIELSEIISGLSSISSKVTSFPFSQSSSQIKKEVIWSFAYPTDFSIASWKS